MIIQTPSLAGLRVQLRGGTSQEIAEARQKEIENKKLESGIEPKYQGFLNFTRVKEPLKIFYPGCGLDGSPAKTFISSEIVFLDPDKDVASVFDKYDLAKNIFINSKAEDYISQTVLFDLCIDQHSYVSVQDYYRQTKLYGYIISETKGSEKFLCDERFELVGVILSQNENTGIFDIPKIDYKSINPSDSGNFSNKRVNKVSVYLFKKMK